MASRLASLHANRSRWFDLGVLVAGLAVFLGAVAQLVHLGATANGPAVLVVPLIVIVARFPMVLEQGQDAIEIGFDSSILMFLLCTMPPHEALVLWSLGLLTTQLTADKRPLIKAFNTGVGIIGGGFAALVLHLVRGGALNTPRELGAVALAATAYFAADYLLSAVSVAFDTATPVVSHLNQRGTMLAIACMVPFDLLGYLGAVVVRATPWWTLILLGIPLATLLIATRAVTRGRENARRLSVLFDAAVRAQTLSDAPQVIDAVADDARKLLRIGRVEVRDTPPGPAELGAQLHDGRDDPWVVAPRRQRARSTTTADKQALEAMAAVASDAFARLRLTDEMTHLARFDMLTDLPNRRLLLDRVKRALQLSRRDETTIALLFIDLDGFKPINDRFGHAAGDEVLVDVADRLGRCVRERDTVARLGGDEFAVLFEGVEPVEVAVACERILAALRAGVHVAGHNLLLGASIGVAYGDGQETAETMLRKADLAMYEAKSNGKNQFVTYEDSIGQVRLQRLELVESLRAAIEQRELRVAYQPIVAADTGRITGVEALARWRLNGENISPDLFIRIAEETGLVVPLGDLILEQAAHDAVALREAAGGYVTISVNVSAKQLRESDFVAKVEEAAQAMGETGLILEITERDGIGSEETTLDTMRYLAARGIDFSIDDFGTGFSSISYLQDMPVRSIKTDSAFSATIDSDPRACGLLTSIAQLGEALGLNVVVEGIERESQMQHLREHVGAAYAQGYLMYRPMPLDQLLPAVRENRARHEAHPVPGGRTPAPAV